MCEGILSRSQNRRNKDTLFWYFAFVPGAQAAFIAFSIAARTFSEIGGGDLNEGWQW